MGTKVASTNSGLGFDLTCGLVALTLLATLALRNVDKPDHYLIEQDTTLFLTLHFSKLEKYCNFFICLPSHLSQHNVLEEFLFQIQK